MACSGELNKAGSRMALLDVRRARIVPARHGVAPKRATASRLTRRELCPQDWQDIWPELADSQPNPPPALVDQGQGAIGSEQQGAGHG